MAELEEINSHINLRNIKSTFIIKKVFSFLDEKQKLIILIYNKENQARLLIDIEVYKKKSGK